MGRLQHYATCAQTGSLMVHTKTGSYALDEEEDGSLSIRGVRSKRGYKDGLLIRPRCDNVIEIRHRKRADNK